ncbi:MAG: DUF4388 domain-containing protein [Desulfomonilia bacterium]|nr:DUF4388 domain-containing protein [Desulfomonilia bacterium]
MKQDISGDLENTRCPEIIKILSLGKRTGRLFLTNGVETGNIFFNEGHVIHAQCGSLSGTKAIYELAVWTSGEYRFHVDEVPHGTTIDMGMEEILAETTNRIRQMDKVTTLIPSSSIVYTLEPDIRERDLQLKSFQWKALANVDAKKSIAEIAQLIGYGVSDTMRIFYTLVKLGLIKEAVQTEIHRGFQPVILPEVPFIESLKMALIKAIGPIAPVIIMEISREMGIDLLSDTMEQKASLIETLSSRIPDERMSLKFLDDMTDWLKADGDHS